MAPVPQQGFAGICTCRAAGSNMAFARKHASKGTVGSCVVVHSQRELLLDPPEC